MKVNLFFGIGNEKKIEQAVREIQYDWLDDPLVVKQQADFSLNLQPKDLTLLSRQFGKYSWQRNRNLRPYLSVLVDEIDRGALLVDHDWVRYVNKVKLEKADRITRSWFNEMKKAYPDEIIEVTDEAQKAVEELILLCKHAVKEDAKVIHWWYL